MNCSLTFLVVLVVSVPALVGAAGIASLLLLRAGYGILVWGLLPLVVLLLVAGVLGAVFGRAARSTPPDRGEGGPKRGDR